MLRKERLLPARGVKRATRDGVDSCASAGSEKMACATAAWGLVWLRLPLRRARVRLSSLWLRGSS
eukprot:15908707-Heterocapsa_arctica.AAC.1